MNDAASRSDWEACQKYEWDNNEFLNDVTQRRKWKRHVEEEYDNPTPEGWERSDPVPEGCGGGDPAPEAPDGGGGSPGQGGGDGDDPSIWRIFKRAFRTLDVMIIIIPPGMFEENLGAPQAERRA